MLLSRFVCFLALPSLLTVAACSYVDSAVSGVGETLGVSDSASSTIAATPTKGLAVADEPLAAKSGAAILSQGGSAADAVTAMFFNYLRIHSILVDLGIWTSLAITLISSFHYILHAARIIDAPPSGRV